MVSLIAIPLKRSYDVDLVKPIKEVIASHSMTSDEQNQIKDNVMSLNKMRANCISKSLDVRSESSLETLQK